MAGLSAQTAASPQFASSSDGIVTPIVWPSGKATQNERGVPAYERCPPSGPRRTGKPVGPTPKASFSDLWVIQPWVRSTSGQGTFQLQPSRHFTTPPSTSAPP